MYVSSLNTTMSRRANSETIRMPSWASSAAPVGLLGLHNTTFVRFVMCGSMSDHRTENVSRSARATSTAVAPSARTAISWFVKYGAGRSTSSPASTRVITARVNA